MKHTPGTWKHGLNYGSVVSDKTDGKLYGGADATEHYGGYLIAESIAEQNRDIIAAAPDMFDALKTIENDAGQVPAWLWEMIQKAIAKAEGRTACPSQS